MKKVTYTALTSTVNRNVRLQTCETSDVHHIEKIKYNNSLFSLFLIIIYLYYSYHFLKVCKDVLPYCKTV